MTSQSTGALRLQAPAYYVAMTAALLLALASASANTLAATAKHTETGPMLIAGAVALSVAFLTMISLPAAMSAFRAKQFIASLIAGLVFVMAAAYSTTSAIGVLAKPRIESAFKETDNKATRANLQADRKRATDELATLAPARTDLAATIASKLATPGANGCNTVNGPISMRVCSEVEALRSEAARADRIGTLTATIARADKRLTDLGSMRVENADAAALTAVFAAFGLVIDSNVVNVALMLLAVVILEVGSGLSLAIAQSLRVAVPVTMKDITPASHSLPVEALAIVPAIIAPANVPAIQTPPTGAAADIANKVRALAESNGGVIHFGSKNGLARRLGTSSGTACRALAILASAGVAVTADNAGVMVKLAA